MEFQLADGLAVLERTPATLNAMLRNLPDDVAKRKEDVDRFSVYDVVGHLNHGEETDWLPRAQIILEHGISRQFDPFDRFAMYEKSQGKSLNQLLDEFETLRSENIQSVRGMNITPAKLNLCSLHPKLGAVTLGQLLATWVVHDLNHIAQIVRILSKQHTEEVGPWKAYLSILNWTT